MEHFVDGSQLKLFTDHAALKWIWDVKSTVNSRLFKWSLILNPLRDKVDIIHRPGRIHNNVDPLSRYPASYSVNLTHIDNSWQEKLWNGYLADRTFGKVVKQLANLNNSTDTTDKSTIDKATQTDPQSEPRPTLIHSTNKVDGSDRGAMVDRQGMDLENGRHDEFVEPGKGERSGMKEMNEAKNDLDRTRSPRDKGIVDEENDSDGTRSPGDKGIADKKKRKRRSKTKGKRRSEVRKGGENITDEEEPGTGRDAILGENVTDEEEPGTGRDTMLGGNVTRVTDEEEPGTGRSAILVEEEPGNTQKGNIKEGSAAEAQTDRVDRTRGIGIGRERIGMEDREERTTGEHENLLEYYEKAKKPVGKEAVATDGTYSLINRCLYFSDRKTASLRLCVPENLVDEILRLCHDKRGHPGIRNTYTSLALRFYFPKMSRRVKQHVAACSQCQIAKPAREKPAGLLQPIESPTEPCHTISLDFVTGLPSSHGYDAMLTVTDTFSKAVRLIACNKTTSAEETAKLFLLHCYPIFGLPYKIISDRDSRFTSKFWETLMQLLDVDLGISTAFHPQADGQSERTNQTVEIALRCFLGGDVDKYPKWVDYLPILEHELNSTASASTGFTPNQIRFAMAPRGLADSLHPLEGASEAAETLAEDLRNRRDEARDSIRTAQRKQKKYYDARKKPDEFNVGDLVLLKFNRFGPGYKAPKPHDHKLAPIGTPFRIREKISPLAYRLILPTGSRMHDVVSIAHLKRYQGHSDFRPMPVDDEHEEFEVERIDGERINSQGSTEFLVKWLGYGENERTWEPLHNLQHADQMVADWRSKQPDQPTNRRKRSVDRRTVNQSTHRTRAHTRSQTLQL